MFAKFEEEKIFRFKEFDEARGYIENLEESKDTFEAIDYMISHKEFYFLLKNVLKQLHTKGSVIEYIFYNLPCLKREEDLDMIIQILQKADETVKRIIIEYLKSCGNFNFAKEMYEKGLKTEAIEVFKKIPEKSWYLKEKIRNETDTEVLKKAFEYFSLFDEEFACKIKEKFGN